MNYFVSFVNFVVKSSVGGRATPDELVVSYLGLGPLALGLHFCLFSSVRRSPRSYRETASDHLQCRGA
jgi:hypothetical protein